MSLARTYTIFDTVVMQICREEVFWWTKPNQNWKSEKGKNTAFPLCAWSMYHRYPRTENGNNVLQEVETSKQKFQTLSDAPSETGWIYSCNTTTRHLAAVAKSWTTFLFLFDHIAAFPQTVPLNKSLTINPPYYTGRDFGINPWNDTT